MPLSRQDLMSFYEQIADISDSSGFRDAASVLRILAAAMESKSEGGYAQFSYWWVIQEAKRLESLRKED